MRRKVASILKRLRSLQNLVTCYGGIIPDLLGVIRDNLTFFINTILIIIFL